MIDPVYTADRICAVLARKTFSGALCVARLASLRMWDAYRERELRAARAA